MVDAIHFNETTRIVYKNWKGVISERKITPHHLEYRVSEFHSKNGEKVWLMIAICHEKGAIREFLLNDILEIL